MTSLKQSHARLTAECEHCEREGERASRSARRSGRAHHTFGVRGHGEVRPAPSRLLRSVARVRRCCIDVVVGPALSSPAWPRMPFISKDWRSPGEEWVKTVEGWEKKKILECANNKTLSLLLRYVIVPRSVRRSRSLPPFVSPVSLFLTLFSVRPRSLFVSRLRAAHSCYSSVYIDPADSSVCLHARARIVARGFLLADSICFAKTRRERTRTRRIIVIRDSSCGDSRRESNFSYVVAAACLHTDLFRFAAHHDSHDETYNSSAISPT